MGVGAAGAGAGGGPAVSRWAGRDPRKQRIALMRQKLGGLVRNYLTEFPPHMNDEALVYIAQTRLIRNAVAMQCLFCVKAHKIALACMHPVLAHPIVQLIQQGGHIFNPMDDVPVHGSGQKGRSDGGSGNGEGPSATGAGLELPSDHGANGLPFAAQKDVVHEMYRAFDLAPVDGSIGDLAAYGDVCDLGPLSGAPKEDPERRARITLEMAGQRQQNVDAAVEDVQRASLSFVRRYRIAIVGMGQVGRALYELLVGVGFMMPGDIDLVVRRRDACLDLQELGSLMFPSIADVADRVHCIVLCVLLPHVRVVAQALNRKQLPPHVLLVSTTLGIARKALQRVFGTRSVVCVSVNVDRLVAALEQQQRERIATEQRYADDEKLREHHLTQLAVSDLTTSVVALASNHLFLSSVTARMFPEKRLTYKRAREFLRGVSYEKSLEMKRRVMLGGVPPVVEPSLASSVTLTGVSGSGRPNGLAGGSGSGGGSHKVAALWGRAAFKNRAVRRFSFALEEPSTGGRRTSIVEIADCAPVSDRLMSAEAAQSRADLVDTARAFFPGASIANLTALSQAVLQTDGMGTEGWTQRDYESLLDDVNGGPSGPVIADDPTASVDDLHAGGIVKTITMRRRWQEASILSSLSEVLGMEAPFLWTCASLCRNPVATVGREEDVMGGILPSSALSEAAFPAMLSAAIGSSLYASCTTFWSMISISRAVQRRVHEWAYSAVVQLAYVAEFAVVGMTEHQVVAVVRRGAWEALRDIDNDGYGGNAVRRMVEVAVEKRGRKVTADSLSRVSERNIHDAYSDPLKDGIILHDYLVSLPILIRRALKRSKLTSNQLRTKIRRCRTVLDVCAVLGPRVLALEYARIFSVYFSQLLVGCDGLSTAMPLDVVTRVGSLAEEVVRDTDDMVRARLDMTNARADGTSAADVGLINEESSTLTDQLLEGVGYRAAPGVAPEETTGKSRGASPHVAHTLQVASSGTSPRDRARSDLGPQPRTGTPDPVVAGKKKEKLTLAPDSQLRASSADFTKLAAGSFVRDTLPEVDVELVAMPGNVPIEDIQFDLSRGHRPNSTADKVPPKGGIHRTNMSARHAPVSGNAPMASRGLRKVHSMPWRRSSANSSMRGPPAVAGSRPAPMMKNPMDVTGSSRLGSDKDTDGPCHHGGYVAKIGKGGKGHKGALRELGHLGDEGDESDDEQASEGMVDESENVAPPNKPDGRILAQKADEKPSTSSSGETESPGQSGESSVSGLRGDLASSSGSALASPVASDVSEYLKRRRPTLAQQLRSTCVVGVTADNVVAEAANSVPQLSRHGSLVVSEPISLVMQQTEQRRMSGSGHDIAAADATMRRVASNTSRQGMIRMSYESSGIMDSVSGRESPLSPQQNPPSRGRPPSVAAGGHMAAATIRRASSARIS